MLIINLFHAAWFRLKVFIFFDLFHVENLDTSLPPCFGLIFYF